MELSLRPAQEDDFEFSFRVKREALGPYIAARWGWDETFQLDLHRRRWVERPWAVILGSGRPVGTVSIEYRQNHVRFGEFYLLPGFQGKGIGSTILQQVLAAADARGMPVKLEHLKWSPVGSLYRRHGFVVTGENDIHDFLERPPVKVEPAVAAAPHGNAP